MIHPRGIIGALCTTQLDARGLYIRKSSHRTGTVLRLRLFPAPILFALLRYPFAEVAA